MPGGGQSWGCCSDSQAPLMEVTSQPLQLVVSNPLLVESLVGGGCLDSGREFPPCLWLQSRITHCALWGQEDKCWGWILQRWDWVFRRVMNTYSINKAESKPVKTPVSRTMHTSCAPLGWSSPAPCPLPLAANTMPSATAGIQPGCAGKQDALTPALQGQRHLQSIDIGHPH